MAKGRVKRQSALGVTYDSHDDNANFSQAARFEDADDWTPPEFQKRQKTPKKKGSNKATITKKDHPPSLKLTGKDATLRDEDVLMGRGLVSTRHPGNLFLWKLVGERHETYKEAKGGKQAIFQGVLVHIEKHGGRFVELLDDELYEVPYKRRYNKVSQAFRELNPKATRPKGDKAKAAVKKAVQGKTNKSASNTKIVPSKLDHRVQDRKPKGSRKERQEKVAVQKSAEKKPKQPAATNKPPLAELKPFPRGSGIDKLNSKEAPKTKKRISKAKTNNSKKVAAKKKRGHRPKQNKTASKKANMILCKKDKTSSPLPARPNILAALASTQASSTEKAKQDRPMCSDSVPPELISSPSLSLLQALLPNDIKAGDFLNSTVVCGQFDDADETEDPDALLEFSRMVADPQHSLSPHRLSPFRRNKPCFNLPLGSLLDCGVPLQRPFEAIDEAAALSLMTEPLPLDFA